uniref:Sperm acrosome associated 7 n=1 Tax=Propithecus coquereli TaxID=379532 RepID=A0A2K6EFI2_PROCO
MAVNRGARTLYFVLLLCCWHKTKLQPINVTSGPTTQMSRSSKTQDIPSLFDEILVQEILEPNKSVLLQTPSMASTLTTNASTDDNYQPGGSENYHELLGNLYFSSSNEDKISNKEASANENLYVTDPQKYQGPQLSSGLETTTSSKGTKNSRADQYERLSVLYKILENMRRSTEERRTTLRSRARRSQ